MRKSINIILKRNILIILLMISMCPVLGFSYARFVINTDSYRSNEMYMAELLYSVKIDDVNTYMLSIPKGESEHIIEITSLNAVSTNYKLIYQNNSNVKIEYASDDWYLVYGNIIKVNKTHIRVTNLTEEEQTIEFNIVGGYYFNDVKDIKVPEGYTDFYEEYWHFDYETMALYVNNTRVEELNSDKYYDLVSYTCSNFNDSIEVLFNSDTQTLNVPINKQTKCSLYFEEIDNPVYNFDYTGKTVSFKVPKTGYYKLEVWGAQGGGYSNYIGGYGGYSRGVIKLNKDETIYVVVGGQGKSQTSMSASSVAGGYNGGGNGYGYTDKYVGGGGGATHISKTDGLLSSLDSGTTDIYEDILIVAGGGGAGSYQPSSDYGYGGHAGGFKGNNGTTNISYAIGTGGTQVSAGTGDTSGGFGKGASQTNNNGTGGGAGLYGGGSGRYFNGGGGGSSYIGNPNLISYKDIIKVMYCYNCEQSFGDSTKTTFTTNVSETATSEYAKKGNGYARITYISTFDLPEITEGYYVSYDTREKEEIFTVPKTGYYKLEVWGAQGGYGKSTTYNGGYGGYASGAIKLNKNDKLYISIGGKGKDGTTQVSESSKGGYNGGGNGYGATDKYVGGGGGATHIANVSGLLSTLSSKIDNILIVAGGGGGGAFETSSFNGVGGNGGGIQGNSNSCNNSSYPNSTGGSQTSTGTGTYKGSFGQGSSCTSNGCAGGGGGYYGGASTNYAGGASGGSGYK